MPDSTPPIPAEASAEKAGPSNLRLRITYGLIGAALLLGSVWFSPVTFGLFFAAVQAVMLWEFYRMMRAGGYAPATWIGVGASVVAFVGLHLANGFGNYLMADAADGEASSPVWIKTAESVAFFRGIGGSMRFNALTIVALAILMMLILLMVILLLREIQKWASESNPFGNIGATITGIMYVGLPMAMLNVLAFGTDHYDYRRIFALLFLIWASDIGAYAVGRAIGKHKLAPKISPGKTWEGWAGGFVLTLVVGWAIGFMLPDMPLTHRLVAAGVVAVFAPLGDLAESMLKRSVGVKDSGSIMPGHGGLLDRFDAFLLVLPVLALLQLLAG